MSSSLRYAEMRRDNDELRQLSPRSAAVCDDVVNALEALHQAVDRRLAMQNWARVLERHGADGPVTMH
jgi:hypothetical protein